MMTRQSNQSSCEPLSYALLRRAWAGARDCSVTNGLSHCNVLLHMMKKTKGGRVFHANGDFYPPGGRVGAWLDFTMMAIKYILI